MPINNKIIYKIKEHTSIINYTNIYKKYVKKII